MNHLWRVLTSSIGKKWIMALSGLGLAGFLVIHLVGNLTIYAGSQTFNSYARHLHSLGPLVRVFETGLGLVAVFHILFAVVLFFQNLWARPQRYHVKSAEGGRSWGSRTMIFTGPYILAFVIFHLLQFTLGGHTEPISTVVAARFGQPPWVAFYTFSMLIVGLHTSHGVWSAFQSLGLPSPRRGAFRNTGVLISWIFALGFGLIPIIVFSQRGLLQ